LDISNWRQYRYNIKTVKKAYRNAQQSKRGNTRNEYKKVKQIKEMHREYIEVAKSFLKKVKETADYIQGKERITLIQRLQLNEIDEYIHHGLRQIDQIKRRVLDKEVIPSKEKVFSLFEPHTEWICKGKLGVPVELGVRVCIVEDKNQFILNHQIMWKQTDEKLTVSIAEETKKKFPNLYSMSYDRGFYSKHNREELHEILDAYSLPKKGKLSETDRLIQSSEDYKKAKEKHSAVESAINALGVHGLDKCPDLGKRRFACYVALAIVARNIQLIGAILQKKERRLMVLRERRKRLKAA